MMRDSSTGRRPTRRDYVKYGGALIGSGLFAGCTGNAGSEETTETTAATTATQTETETATETATPEDDSYSVAMAPVGDVEFDSVPKSIFTRLTHLAGMAFALGRGDDVNAMHAPDYYHALWNQFTPHLDGVSVNWSGLYSSWKPSKEKLYELDSDVHLADPASVFALDKWSVDDLEEVDENIGPWFGNSLSDTNKKPPSQWADSYEYYGLWEMFEKVAAVFREEERYEALAAVHEDLLSTIESNLPDKQDRPTAVMALASEITNPWVYKTDIPGFLSAHIRPLQAREALGEDVESGAKVDMETLLEADPDVLFVLGGMSTIADMKEVRSTLKNDSVGSQLSAVQNGRVYAQGARYQGPILNLFQLEMTAKQLYPDQFGEWPTYESGSYPDIPAEEQLFDRQHVANIINGEF
ncbi:ABC transporter substrate-binding protein [Haloferax larsenii]|uniref:ABC-type Fe3+-hydroxamate transport system, substrate-binding protein n=1 Tax=Haloferax larsenii TaxID=302484 RepID=A0A1H7QUH8_HALLR|nr:ABC transporter substrate-binding protein [Haloferax larsenii]SEL51374.1 ABC-type Fe3+-hydroxamate transport system, substrate-binding protein [Haloferax larsenii]